MHVALRCPKGKSLYVDGEDVVPAVHNVLEKVSEQLIDCLRNNCYLFMVVITTHRLPVSLRE